MAAALARPGAQGSDPAGADGLTLMRVLGIPNRAPHGALLTGHAANASRPFGRSAGVAAPMLRPHTAPSISLDQREHASMQRREAPAWQGPLSCAPSKPAHGRRERTPPAALPAKRPSVDRGADAHPRADRGRRETLGWCR
jgi:hypothetical protein